MGSLKCLRRFAMGWGRTVGFICLNSFAASAPGQLVNSWTNATSGYWFEPHWSLGALPGTNQSVTFTNTGWKALAIGPITVREVPQSLHITSLTVSAPLNSFNTLLLNYAGLQPLVIDNSFVVASNAAVLMLASSLEVRNSGTFGRFAIGGTFTETEFSSVNAGVLSLGEIGPGTFNLTNSLLAVGTEFVGGAFPSVFHQSGGTNLFNTLHLNNATYHLHAGFCSGIVLVGDVSSGANFRQSGGAVSGDIGIARGSYLLENGSLAGPGLIVPAITFDAFGSFVQTGGTNSQAGSLWIGSPAIGFDSIGSYGLSNGVLSTESTIVSFLGTFSQENGIHTIHSGLALQGAIIGPFQTAAYAFYTLAGGLLSSEVASVFIGFFTQSGGTHEARDLFIGPSVPTSTYTLDGGTLQTSNTVLFSSFEGAFRHNGGTHRVANGLSIFGSPTFPAVYQFNAGKLSVPHIEVSMGTFHHAGGELLHSGILTLSGGVWQEGASHQQLGQLRLGGAGAADSSVALSTGSCLLRFADSRSLVWSNQATLTVLNWSDGETGEGGGRRIFFGDSAEALTAQQVSRIRFRDPAGFAPGLYPAQLLATGELTPAPVLRSMAAGRTIVLQWENGFVLQSATNVAGPYEDLAGAASPYSHEPLDSQRFFRLRRSSDP